jgi:hypothetical protein
LCARRPIVDHRPRNGPPGGSRFETGSPRRSPGASACLTGRGFQAVHRPPVAEGETLSAEEAPRQSCHLLPCHGAVVRRSALGLDVLKGLTSPVEHRRPVGVALPPTHRDTYFGSSSTTRARRPVFSAAMMVVRMGANPTTGCGRKRNGRFGGMFVKSCHPLILRVTNPSCLVSPSTLRPPKAKTKDGDMPARGIR